MTLRQLHALDVVVRTGSFTAAAKALAITQPALSHALGELERELKIKLLTRARNGVSLSTAGERLICHVREILSQTNQLSQAASDIAGGLSGRLRVGVISSVATRLLPALLAMFSKLHPRVEIVLFEGADQEVAEWLNSSVVDVGLLAVRSPGLTSQVIAKDRVFAVIPQQHPLASKPRISIGAIAKEPFVMSKAGCEALIRRMYDRQGHSPEVAYEARDVSTILGMVREGLGVSIVPELALPERVPGIKIIPLQPTIKREILLATRSQQGGPTARAFVACTARWLAKSRLRVD